MVKYKKVADILCDFFIFECMKTALIIPVHNQAKHWSRMIKAIEELSEYPDTVYVMMDRPKKSDFMYVNGLCKRQGKKCEYEVIESHDKPAYMGRPQENDDDNFLAGHVRNKAIDLAISEGHEIFIFIDGDCIPEVDIVKDHKKLNSLGIPNLSVGRRRDERHNWKDQREVDNIVKGAQLFTSGNGYVVQNVQLLVSSTIVWTCNVSINIDAINRIKRLNQRYYERAEVFNSEFSGTWGGEDGFLGFQCFYSRIYITMCASDKSGIRHIDHPRPESKYGDVNWDTYFKERMDDFDSRLSSNPLTSEFYVG